MVYYVLSLVLIAIPNDELSKAIYVHYMFTLQSLYIHCISIVHCISLYVHYIFTTCSRYGHCIWMTAAIIARWLLVAVYYIFWLAVIGILNGKLDIAI